MEDLVYIGIFLTLTTTGKAKRVYEFSTKLERLCSGMCDSFMLMKSVSSGFWPPNDFYHAVCNIHSVLRGIQDYGAVFYCGLFKYY